MPTNPSAEMEALAQRLTAAQRKAVVQARPGGFGYSATTLYVECRRSTMRALVAVGIVNSSGRLTPLGLALRAHILNEEPRHD